MRLSQIGGRDDDTRGSGKNLGCWDRSRAKLPSLRELVRAVDDQAGGEHGVGVTPLTTYQLLEHSKVVGWAEGFGAGLRCAVGRA